MGLRDFSGDCDIRHFYFGNEHATMLYASTSPSSTHSPLSTCAKAMGNRKISSDMKKCALKLWDQGWDTEDSDISTLWGSLELAFIDGKLSFIGTVQSTGHHLHQKALQETSLKLSLVLYKPS